MWLIIYLTGGKHKAEGGIRPSTLCYPARHLVSIWRQHRALIYPLRSSYIYTVLNYIRPFEGNCEADVATGENDFDTPKSFIKPNNYAEVVNVATRKIQFY